jgi:hypothetical protein
LGSARALAEIDVIRNNFGLALAALATPFQRPGSFLRCAVLPFTLCMAVAGFIATLGIAYPPTAGNPTTKLPAVVQGLGLFLLGLAVLSLTSFSINWRRALSLSKVELGVAPLLSIDARTFAYMIAKVAPSSKEAQPQRSRHWVMGILRLVAFFLAIAAVLLVIAIGLFGSLIFFRPDQQALNTAFSVVAPFAFMAVYCMPHNGRERTALAIDVLPGDLAETPKPTPTANFLMLIALAGLPFAALALFLPLPMTAQPTLDFLLAAAVWIGALFLAIGWFAAAETLLYSRMVHPSAQAEHQGAGGSERGHRQFRRPARLA